MMRKFGLWLLGFSVLGAFSAVAAPRNVPQALKSKTRYTGAHPVAVDGNGYCQIDVPHTHDYAPDKPNLYQRVGDDYVFSGDPVPFGYDGEKTVYYGHHPIPLNQEGSLGALPPPSRFCFLKGPHHHEYPAPPAMVGYKVQNNVIFYVGPIPPEVSKARPQIEKTLEVEYRPYAAQRPKVVVEPPPEWQGTVYVEPPPVVVAPANPTVVVAPPTPVVVAPPVPAVVVAPPAPVVIGVPGAVILHGHGHGHHKGWFHPGKGKGHWKRW